MYRFSYVENVAAQPQVADRQQFLQLLRSEKVKQTCEQILQAPDADALNLQVDACTKDLARLSFCVPEAYFLYLNEKSLFEGEGDTGRRFRNDKTP